MGDLLAIASSCKPVRCWGTREENRSDEYNYLGLVPVELHENVSKGVEKES